MGCFGSKDKLSKEDMDFLKTHTRYDEATIKEWYKGFKQDCPNGRLTPAKFVDMYKMFFPSGNAEEFCDHVFRTFDMDKNGYIDFKNKKKHAFFASKYFRVFGVRLSKMTLSSLNIGVNTKMIIPLAGYHNISFNIAGKIDNVRNTRSYRHLIR
ncbi:unnamed protein product [Nesidiocoris tenuis]|uniref:EF-hand domain-containing protein n=1 Tax=Nesidiocoris tenuis TaxID=355587 RepID=A0A6H5GM69_9HEMI|nr:unnamed protein product [Nesidiocoris tenuis]